MTTKMLRHCTVLLSLALISLGDPASAQNPDGSNAFDIQALDVTLTNHGPAATSAEVVSSVTSSSLVDEHNDVRGRVLASNMEYVDQNGSLTGDVMTWLHQCSFGDALVVHWDDANYPFINGFKVMSSSSDSITEIISFISRMPSYSSLYRLLMKYDIRYLGCGIVQCPVLGGHYSLSVCIYASRSELNVDEAPYKSGAPCTRCSSGTFWCLDNLCKDDCYETNAHCECRMDCGEYSAVASNCSCLCPSGNDCKQHDDDNDDDDDDLASDWSDGGTTLVISVTLVLLALLCVSLCLILYHKKYRLDKLRPRVSAEAPESTPRTTSVYSTSSSSSSSTFDPSKYPSAPPAYSSISLTTGLDPPPYGFTASPTDAAEEVGDGESPPLYEQINA